MKSLMYLTMILLLSTPSFSKETKTSSQVLQGKNWTGKKINNTYIVSINNKSSIIDALNDFVASEKIAAGQITGIGATDEVTLRFFEPNTKKFVDKTFKEQLEITNLSGNISEVSNKITLHLHITLGRRDYTALAGHLLDAKTRGAGEFFVYPIDAKIIKTKNEEAGLNFYNFNH